jgi:Tfp pilus assembly protein PilZ
VSERREHPRHRVHLSIRFGQANEFVQQFADNLSQGGLFVPGDHRLKPEEEIDAEIDLPGLGTFRVRAKVAHQIAPKAASQSGGRAGVGLKITRAPEGFQNALNAYLRRLGQRKKTIVFARDAACAAVLHEAGYQVAPVPAPIKLAAAIDSSTARVVGVVVPPPDLDDYAAAAASIGMGNLAIAMHSPAELDIVLALLDHNLTRAATRATE